MAEEHGFEDEEGPEGFLFEDKERPEDILWNPSVDDDLTAPEEGDLRETEVTVVDVFEHTVDEQGNGQASALVLLRDSRGRSVPIFIGKFEAVAIWLALKGASADRPLTHDLLNSVIAKMGGKVVRILIDDLWNQTYYAKLTITIGEKEVVIDSRPSDGIALALRAKAPIYMAEGVLERAAVQEE